MMTSCPLDDGVPKSELDRAQTGLKASTIMSSESTSPTGAIAHDYFMRGRIRTLDGSDAINAVTGIA